MMMALVFSSLVVTQKPAKAADGDPTVEVLGATLRLDNETGTQSLRFGIQVKNADKAKSCSIDVKVGNKTLTVSTDDGTNTNIYKKSDDGKTIIYTVVVTGIDTQNFNTPINFTGKATAIDQAVDVVPTSETPKTVNGVVDAMGNDIYLSNTGVLVKKVDSLSFDAVPASAPNMSEAAVNAFSIYEGASGEISEGVLSLTNTSNSGVMYKFGAGDSNKYIISIEVKGETDKYFALTNYGTPLNDMGGISKSDGRYYVEADGSYQKLDYSVTNSGYSSYEINSRGNGTTLSIKSFVIGKVLEQSDLKDVDSLEDLQVTLSSDNVIPVQAYGQTPTVTVADGIASLTTTNNDQALAVNVALANGVKLSDYKGISFTFTNNSGVASGYKKIMIDLKSKDDNTLYAPCRNKGQNIFSSEQFYIEQGFSQTITGDFKDMSSIDESYLTGIVTLSIGLNYNLDGANKNYSISNVKLLAK